MNMVWQIVEREKANVLPGVLVVDLCYVIAVVSVGLAPGAGVIEQAEYGFVWAHVFSL